MTSALANNAVQAAPGRSILLGRTPQEYATHILRLLDDHTERERLAEEGFRFVRNQFNWDHSANDLERLLTLATTARVAAP